MRLRTSENPLAALAVLAGVLIAASVALIFFYVPTDADQGFSQRIFYIHVPVALTAYAFFGWGAWKALRHLWKREPGADLESYVAIHQGVIFGALTLLTGSMFLTLCVSLAAMLTLAATLFHVELAGKRIDSRLRELRELLA